MAPDADLGSPSAVRVRVFVDFWNFQLTLNEITGGHFKVDWRKLGPCLAKRACEGAGIAQHTFEGCTIYTSYNPANVADKRYHNWVTTWLDRQPGVTVRCRERRPKQPPRCPACHTAITICPHCAQQIKASVEKGVDTLIATDMIRLAWEQAYDLAVLATIDADLVPAVQFLDLKGRKVIQAGFPPKGTALATACWASFNVAAGLDEIRRAESPPGFRGV